MIFILATPIGAPVSTLALVPAGLAAVAVFPPYATPRTQPAETVIFSEDPSFSLPQTRALKRSGALRKLLNIKKRSIWISNRTWRIKQRRYISVFQSKYTE